MVVVGRALGVVANERTRESESERERERESVSNVRQREKTEGGILEKVKR